MLDFYWKETKSKVLCRITEWISKSTEIYLFISSLIYKIEVTSKLDFFKKLIIYSWF